MFFCKSCSKLLDEDLKICPYCGATEDESILSPDTSKLEIRLQEEDLKEAPKTEPQSLDISFTSSTVGANSLDETINKINEMIEKNQQDISDTFGEPEQLKLDFQTFDETIMPSNPSHSSSLPPTSSIPYSGGTPRSSAPEEYEDLSTGLKVGLILLSFIPVVGIIFGAIYMGKKNPKHKSFGKIVLIISIIFTVLTLMCCCSVFFLALAASADY